MLHNDFINKHWSNNSNADSNPIEIPDESVTVNLEPNVPVKHCRTKTKKGKSNVHWDTITTHIQNQKDL